MRLDVALHYVMFDRVLFLVLCRICILGVSPHFLSIVFSAADATRSRPAVWVPSASRERIYFFQMYRLRTPSRPSKRSQE